MNGAVRTDTAAKAQGPLDWRALVEWLRTDGVIAPDEAERTIARCSQAESAQHPLVRLASVSMRRAADNRALDIESLTEWLAGRAGMGYLRIDPLKVDVGKVADAMSAPYAERHRVLPVQVTPTEMVVATAEPFIHDWVAEVERQSRRSVRRVLASPQEIARFTAEFYALAKSVRSAMKSGGGNAGASFEQLVELGKANKQLDAIKETGGMVGINFHIGFLREDGRSDQQTSLSEIVRHMTYIADRIGIDHVGFGSDFDGATMPHDLVDVTGLPKLIAALREAGYDDTALKKVTHQNWVRVLQKTWDK